MHRKRLIRVFAFAAMVSYATTSESAERRSDAPSLAAAEVVQRVLMELRDFSSAVDAGSSGRSDEGSDARLISILVTFQERLPGLEKDSSTALANLRALVVRERPELQLMDHVLSQLRAERARVASLSIAAEARGASPAQTSRQRRARQFAKNFLSRWLDSEMRRVQKRRDRTGDRDSALRQTLFDLDLLSQRLADFFSTARGALPRAIQALRDGKQRREASLPDLKILGKSPGELLDTLERTRRSMLRILELQVETLPSATNVPSNKASSSPSKFRTRPDETSRPELRPKDSESETQL